MKEILELLAGKFSIEKQHIESFDRYLATKDNPNSAMQKIIDEFVADSMSRPGCLVFYSSDRDEIRLQFGRESVKSPPTIWCDRPVMLERNGEIHESSPSECRIRDQTYEAPMYLHYKIYINDEFHSENSALIGYHPVITGSSHFLQDPTRINPNDQGFFIIRGVERFFPFAEYGSTGMSQTIGAPGGSKTVVSRRLVQTGQTQRTLYTISISYRGELMLVLRENVQVSLFLVFAAFGLTVKEIYDLFTIPNRLRNVVILSNIERLQADIKREGLDTPEKISDYLVERVERLETLYQQDETPRNFLDHWLFQHLGSDPHSRMQKQILLIDMTLRIFEHQEEPFPPIDRDHLGMKRLKMCGETLEEIFIVLFRRFLKDLSSRINRIVRKKLTARTVLSLKPYFKPDVFTSGIEQILATGIFQSSGTEDEYTITELFTANTMFAQRTNLQKVFSTLGKTQTHFDAREQHPTAWGRYCATETPEGSNCGLIKRLSTGARITFEADEQGIYAFRDLYLANNPIDLATAVNDLRTRKLAIVYCRSVPLLVVQSATAFMLEFENYRKDPKHRIDPTITVQYEARTNTVEILTDRGRIIRPVFSVERERIRNIKRVYRRLLNNTLDLDYLLENRIVRYIDALQEENEIVSPNYIERPKSCSNCKSIFYYRYDKLNLMLSSVPRFYILCHKCGTQEFCRNTLLDYHTACEIDSEAILGLSTSLLPFPEFNSAPRSSKGAAILRQTISAQQFFNIIEQTVPKSEFLLNGQRPIVITRAFEKQKLENTFLISNYVVAISPFYGFNMQDAIILNRDAVDRGMGKCLKIEQFVTSILDYPSGESDRVERLEESVMKRQETISYQKIDQDGIINCASVIQDGDVLLSKTSPQKFLQSDQSVIFTENRRDVSLIFNSISRMPSRIQNIILSTVPSSFPIIKIFVRTFERPEIGDKMASRHGQKGVIGQIIPGQDMPFLEGGIIPDMIINPHALPARMTPGHLLEMFAGLLGCENCELYDGTAFTHEGVEFFQQLDEMHHHHQGLFRMFNSLTGSCFENKIFSGVISYLRLHHISANKLHYRSTGPTQILTRQPTEGKSRHGGLRIGEMEKDCLNAHGVASIAKERLAGVSDLSVQYICSACHQMITPRMNEHQQEISPCHPSYALRRIQIPYGFKLLIGELFSLGIKVTFTLKQRQLEEQNTEASHDLGN